MSDEAKPERLLADHGPLELQQTNLKAHTCCRYKQGPIDALLEIRRERGVDPSEIDSTRVGMLSAGLDLVSGEGKRRPRNVVDEQFSMPYGAAVALVDGRADLAQYTEARIADPELESLMDRVECVTDARLDALYPARWPAWAEVRTCGKTYRVEVPDPKGDPSHPLDRRERREKFDALCGAVYSATRCDRGGRAGNRRAGSLKTLVDLLPSDAETA